MVTSPISPGLARGILNSGDYPYARSSRYDSMCVVCRHAETISLPSSPMIPCVDPRSHAFAHAPVAPLQTNS